jgi:hypothetical protein
MPPICLSGKAARANGDVFVGGIGCSDEMMDRKAERTLRFFIANNPDPGSVPSATPRIDMSPHGRRQTTYTS